MLSNKYHEPQFVAIATIARVSRRCASSERVTSRRAPVALDDWRPFGIRFEPAQHGRSTPPCRCAAHTVDCCGSSQIGQHWLARMGSQLRTVSAKDAKYNFGELIDKARAAPVTVAKYGRPVVVVMAVEEYERLKGLAREGKSASKVARSTRLLAIRSRRK